MANRIYICNNIERREYFLPDVRFVVRIHYGYPHVLCRVMGTQWNDTIEEYRADKRHPQWQRHIQVFETLAWHKYRKPIEPRPNLHTSGRF